MEDSRPPLSLTLARGMCGHCPRCGGGRIFASYLKPVAACAVCGEKLGHIRADDGPAWLTIVLVGHIIAPFLLHELPDSTWPEWLHLIVWPSLAAALTLVILPRAKGLFIGLLWRQALPHTPPA